MMCCPSNIIGVAHKYRSSLQRKDPSTAVCLHEANYFLWHLICLPRFRKGSFAPTGDICVYIHLLVVYTYTLTTKSVVFTFP